MSDKVAQNVCGRTADVLFLCILLAPSPTSSLHRFWVSLSAVLHTHPRALQGAVFGLLSYAQFSHLDLTNLASLFFFSHLLTLFVLGPSVLWRRQTPTPQLLPSKPAP